VVKHFRLWVRLLGIEPLRALRRNKLRSALTALGIMVGVAAVIWVVAIGQAGTMRAEAELSNLGDNLVWVEAGSRNVNGTRTGNHGTTSLTSDDAEAIRHEMSLIKSVAENVDGNVQVIHGNSNYKQTGLLQAHAAYSLLQQPPRRAGFASACQAFGHRELLGVLRSFGLVMEPELTVKH